ncbi:PIN domain-containing protein [Candidatus Pacearchaeota archaeon]|nr:PIN domain-containing protein [Candidatus Pacearchaeota archaeon]
MNYDYVIDSYAWIEYFKGSKQGEAASRFIESEKAATSVISIAELSEKYLKEKKDFQERLSFMIFKTKIINLTSDIALEAGKLNFENKKKIKDFGMADAIILATAKLVNGKVVTGDEHFINLNSIMIK